MITIIDYGLGNIRAFTNVYERLNIKTRIARSADELKSAQKLILPGVGSFDHAITLLGNAGMRNELDMLVLGKKIPVLGICLGMQIMAKSSEEGALPGLGWINGSVKRFDLGEIRCKTKFPHMGWNTISINKAHSLFIGLTDHTRFYFLHSYYFCCHDASDIMTTTTYGIEFSSALSHDNVFGIQFHPEKSHGAGVQILKNFAIL